ncbi:hypothetical protein AVEN_275143-1 [Araneus ventricosus]|uniref:Uncharacterized protein n=1 Tax=Araneus ventricosus TaxID=182803 RepID=A0A4Y2LM02_ARAVE|nr:hypothetical protein AVEN_275143-1 [Araneus ventricosus]
MPRVEATRRLFGDGRCNFEPCSDDGDDTGDGAPTSPNFRAAPGVYQRVRMIVMPRPRMHSRSSAEANFDPGALWLGGQYVTIKPSRPSVCLFFAL